MLYFSYAVLMSRGQMKLICPTAKPVGRAVLHGYRMTFPRVSGTWMGGIPSLCSDAGEEVWGVLWEDSEDCLASLDDYQGFYGSDGANVFDRLAVEVTDAEGTTHAAFAYAATGDNWGNHPPSSQFVDTVVRAAREFGLPKAYVAKLERLGPG